MGEHTGPVLAYRSPRRRWQEALLGFGGTVTLYVITALGIFVGRLVLLASIPGAVIVGAVIASLWIAVWVARRTVDRVRITDRHHWERAESAGATVVRHLPATGLLPAAEVRAMVRRELHEILDLLVEQDRLLAVQREARSAAGDLPAGEPARSELDAELIELDERLRGLLALVGARVARLTGLAAQATDLATIEARRRRARQVTSRIRHELGRSDALPDGHQPADAVERAESVLAAYRELAPHGSVVDGQAPLRPAS
ncbi:hypothetical protein ODJ79_27515 [Actinoplanes sp. KI2]|uniref:hypothetical protein n=1 Tax=Actinoplanes sp. KI2 TaxID=2983315 RepID=UPI0021D5EA40|nr:hypothetical protein [Actinoplanes sp. KI2]MCU7727485.1 hypothetical protein [Actinoplanes sp. KI2]